MKRLAGFSMVGSLLLVPAIVLAAAIGVNDPPTITSADDMGAVSEDAAATTLQDTGMIVFNDTDVADTHTASVVADPGNTLGGTLTVGSLIPPGLSPGDPYHLAFATSFEPEPTGNNGVPGNIGEFGGVESANWLVTFAGFNAGQSGSLPFGLVADDVIPGWNGIDIVYKAILSTSTINAVDNVDIQGHVFNMGGELLATQSSDFFDGELANPITYNEFAQVITGNQEFWSGSNFVGTWAGPTAGCGDWDSAVNSASTARVDSVNWIAGGGSPCVSQNNRLGAIGPVVLAGAGGIDEDPTTEEGSVSWTYQVSNAATQYLNTGQTATESFTVTIDDGNGGTVDQLITITITGTDDDPLPLGDANGDGEFNNVDIAAFVLALTSAKAYAAMYPDVDPEVVLDMNDDGAFDNVDIAAFVAALTGP